MCTLLLNLNVNNKYETSSVRVLVTRCENSSLLCRVYFVGYCICYICSYMCVGAFSFPVSLCFVLFIDTGYIRTNLY